MNHLASLLHFATNTKATGANARRCQSRKSCRNSSHTFIVLRDDNKTTTTNEQANRKTRKANRKLEFRKRQSARTPEPQGRTGMLPLLACLFFSSYPQFHCHTRYLLWVQRNKCEISIFLYIKPEHKWDTLYILIAFAVSIKIVQKDTAPFCSQFSSLLAVSSHLEL